MNVKAIETGILILSIASPIAPLIAGFKNRSNLLWFYVLTGLIFDLTLSFLKRIVHVDHHWLMNLFVIIEFIFISVFYRKRLFRNDLLLGLFVSILVVLFTVNTLIKGIFDFNSFGASFFLLSFLAYGILGLYTLLQEQKVAFLGMNSFFWVNIALIIYASGNFLLFLFKDYLRKQNDALFLLLWAIFFTLLNITKNILLAIALSRRDVEAKWN